MPINDRNADSYVGDQTLVQRAAQAARASGMKGSCVKYVSGIREKLRELEIVDPAVEEFYAAVRGASRSSA